MDLLSEKLRSLAVRKIRTPAIWSLLRDRAEEAVLLEAENERLKKRDEFLSALEQAGVDNWGGHSCAVEILETQ